MQLDGLKKKKKKKANQDSVSQKYRLQKAVALAENFSL